MKLKLLFPILVFAIFISDHSARAGSFDYPTAALGSRWINDPSRFNNSVDFFDGSKVRAFLLRGSLGPRFACGFYCTGSTCGSGKNSSSKSFLFGVFIVITNSASGIVMPAIGFPQPIWSANRHRAVSEGATLELRKDGNLVLQDSDGSLVWDSGTASSGVDGMSLDDSGNLILHSSSKNGGSIVWQSFDHPADAIVPGQILKAGSKLISSKSSSDPSQGDFLLEMEEQGLVLYVVAKPQPQLYWRKTVEPAGAGKSAFARYSNGSLELFVTSPRTLDADASIPLPRIQSAQYLRLSHDGRLLLFAWNDDRGWRIEEDLLQSEQRSPSKCNLPTACGRFGVCTDEGECSCPKSFLPVDALRPSKGCVPPEPYRCSPKAKIAQLLELPGIDYFANDFSSGIWGRSLKQCRDSCSSDCSCRAAFYRNGANAARKNEGGVCYLVTDLFTLRNSYRGPGYTSIAYLKV